MSQLIELFSFSKISIVPSKINLNLERKTFKFFLDVNKIQNGPWSVWIWGAGLNFENGKKWPFKT